MSLNTVAALTVGFISFYLFYHFLIVKDGIARILLMAFFSTISIWALTRGFVLHFISQDLINPRTGMDIIANVNYLIYIPVVFSIIYLTIKKGK